MKYRKYVYALFVATASLWASCTSDMAGESKTTTADDSIHQLTRLYVQVEDEDERGLTRISSVDNQWREGDCVYIRNVDGVYEKDKKWRRYIYRKNGYFTPFSSHPDSVINFIGSNHYVEAYFRGDDQKGGGNGSDGRAEPTTEGAECSGLLTPFTVLADQTTEEKVQQCDFLYTKQKVVYMENMAENIGAVYVQLKHKVSQVFVNVQIGTGHTLKYVHINNGSTKLYQVAQPTRSGSEELDLVGTVKYPSNTETEVKYIDPQPSPNNATAYAKDGFYQFKCFIVPQQVAESNMQQHFVDICVTKDGTDYHYYYDLPVNHTFVKGRTYTYSLTLTENNFKNVFDIHQAQDALTNRDLGKILCVGGWLVPTVTEAKLKGFKPMGMLVQFSGNVNDGYTGLCMSLEDVAKNTTLADALTAVYNYKKQDTEVSHNPGDLNWCSDWFIPTEEQWKSVMGYSLNGQQGDADYVNNTQGIGGVYYANKNHTDMIADLRNDQGDDYEHTEMSCVALAENTNYWTSSITAQNAATTLKNASSGQETTNNAKTAKANTRAFFYFDSRTTPNITSLVNSNCKIFIKPLLEATKDDVGKVIIVDGNKNGYVYTYSSTISNIDYNRGQYLDGYALLASVGSGITATGESSYSHGLAIRLEQINGTYKWHTNDNNKTNESDTYFPTYPEHDGSNYVNNQLMSENIGGYVKTSAKGDDTAYPAFYQCWQLADATPTASGATNHWFLPTIRQWAIAIDMAGEKSEKAFRLSKYYDYTGSWRTWTGNKDNAYDVMNYFLAMFSNVGGTPMVSGNYQWSSSEASTYDSSSTTYSYFGWTLRINTNTNNDFYLRGNISKNTAYYVRPFYAF